MKEGTGAARLLDMIEGRSKSALKAWLAERPEQWRQGIEVAAMDGFSGYKTAASEELPTATAVMDPFHVVHLAADALDRCRQRVQQATTGHRGRAGDPLFSARRALRTGNDLLTVKQRERLEALLARDEHVEVEVTWAVYHKTISAYRHPDRRTGRRIMAGLIEAIGKGVPGPVAEVAALGRTLTRRTDDILAYFDRPGTSNGPTEATGGRLEHLRGIALGFRNLTHCTTRSLLEAGGFRPRQHPQM